MTRQSMRSLAALLLAAAAGCQAESPAQQTSMQDRQDQALKDPFGYGPSSTTAGAPARPGQTPTDAGSLKKRDDSLKGEWNEFWNP